MASHKGIGRQGAVSRPGSHCRRTALAALFALLACPQVSALSVSAQCLVPGVGGLVGETQTLFAACANETLPSDAAIVVGATRAAANGATGTMRVRTEQDVAAAGFAVSASAGLSETIVIDQPWDGMLELTLSVIGSGGPRFLFSSQLDPLWDPAGLSATVAISLGVDAAGGGHYDFAYTQADGWQGTSAGASADFVAGGTSINGAVSKTFLIPGSAVGLPLELSWSVSFRQWATGYLDGYHTGVLGITLPEGFTYTPSSPAFLSTPVPLPGSLALLCAGLAGIAVRARSR